MVLDPGHTAYHPVLLKDRIIAPAHIAAHNLRAVDLFIEVLRREAEALVSRRNILWSSRALGGIIVYMKLKKASPNFSRNRWLQQWSNARTALAQQKKEELRAMTQKQALAASDALLNLGAVSKLNPSRAFTSGLVEQQALFQKLISR